MYVLFTLLLSAETAANQQNPQKLMLVRYEHAHHGHFIKNITPPNSLENDGRFPVIDAFGNSDTLLFQNFALLFTGLWIHSGHMERSVVDKNAHVPRDPIQKNDVLYTKTKPNIYYLDK